MSRRRHSSTRATTFQRSLRQQASVGLRGSRGQHRGNDSNINTRERIDRVKEIIERELAQKKAGLSESDIERINEEFYEAEETVLLADPDIAGLEEQQ